MLVRKADSQAPPRPTASVSVFEDPQMLCVPSNHGETLLWGIAVCSVITGLLPSMDRSWQESRRESMEEAHLSLRSG